MASIMKHNQELIREHFEETANMIKSLADGSWEETYDRNIKEELSERFYKLGIGVDRININYNNRKFSIDIAKPPCFNERQCNTLIPSQFHMF